MRKVAFATVCVVLARVYSATQDYCVGTQDTCVGAQQLRVSTAEYSVATLKLCVGE